MKNCELRNKNPILDTPNFAVEEDIKILEKIIEKTKISILVNNYYALNFNTQKFIGAGLNVYNTISANYLNLPVITAESNIAQTIKFPYMTFRHCPIKQHLKSSCKNCQYNNNYKMENGKILTLKRKKLATCTFYLF